MSKINYNDISKIYDQVREGEMDAIQDILETVALGESSAILDIGCGTGNYTNVLQRLTKARVCGTEPSEGMLAKAKEKNADIEFKAGDAENIPFEDNAFDLVYMTDVIHHVPNISRMFGDIYRVLKKGGKAAIYTQSHIQIDARFMTEFFPASGVADKNRYPDIDAIREAAEKNGLKFIEAKPLGQGRDLELGAHFLELIEKKGYSMLHLISDEEYNTGLEKFKNELSGGTIIRKAAGMTMVWLVKQ